MKKSIAILGSIIISFVLLVSFSGDGNPTALDIIKKSDAKIRGKTNQATLSMTIERPSWSRTIEMKSWSKGTDYMLIYITAPAREKGQVFLKRESEMWNWVPSIERLIKLPPSMMMQSWMGSDFTNDDLVKESSVVKDYTHKLLGEEEVRGKMCYKIELVPLPEAPVVWGRIISWITKDGYDTWQVEFYDEDDYLVNIQNSYDIKLMDDRKLPSRMEIIPVDKKGHKTILIYLDMEFDEPIDDAFFSQQNMKRIR